ncbi:hypothetical protein Tco_1068354 [Tanacetum coccineum]|uniref:Uncharacterized protein n=1 Tax=Tanacetum coccineum TaxID=301880 RepID=A0ABQ5HHA1_9ASTR
MHRCHILSVGIFVVALEFKGYEASISIPTLYLPGQMTYPVASLTLDSARSYVMQGAPFTKRMIFSIPIGGSISPEGFLPSIMLMVFMVTVIIVVIILVVVVVAIFRVVAVFGFSLGLVFLFGLSAFAIVEACASRMLMIQHKFLEFKTSRDRYGDNGVSDPIGGLVFKGSSGTGSLPNGPGMICNELSNSANIDLSNGLSGGGIVDLTGDEDPTDEDGDIKMGDSTGVSMSLGGEISLEEKKSQESNIGDSDNTRD